MAFVTTAIIGGGAALLGGYLSSQGAQNAANIQAGAATQNEGAVLQAGQQASGLDLGAIGKANSYLQPYADLGAGAAGQLKNLLTGVNGGYSQQILSQMPGYQFQLQQGLESTQNGFAAKGLGSSGAAMKGAADYVNGLTASNLSNFYNMLMGGTQVGANAASVQAQNTSNLTTAGANALMGGATNAASLGMAGATAAAAGQVGAANAIAGGISNAGNTFGQYSVLSNMLTNPGMYAGVNPGGYTVGGTVYNNPSAYTNR
jgi:hypothetical protein